jgi:hypothetical protein
MMQKNINYLIELFKKYEGYIHNDLYIKSSQEKRIGIFCKKKINKKQILIKVPINLTINYQDFLGFIKSKRVNYPYIDFLKIYLHTLPNNNFYLENHPCYMDNIEKNLIIQVVEKNQILKDILIYFFKNSESLDSDEKFTFVTFLTRSIKNKKNENILMPVLDLVNYDYYGIKYEVNDDFLSIKNNKSTKNDNEICCRYTADICPLEFFMTYGFIPKDYISFKIPKNFIFVKTQNLNIINASYSRGGGRHYFNEDLIFKENKRPKNIGSLFKMLSKENVLGLLNFYEKSINENLIDRILEEKKYSKIMYNLCETMKLYIENIRSYKLLFD